MNIGSPEFIAAVVYGIVAVPAAVKGVAEFLKDGESIAGVAKNVWNRLIRRAPDAAGQAALRLELQQVADAEPKQFEATARQIVAREAPLLSPADQDAVTL